MVLSPKLYVVRKTLLALTVRPVRLLQFNSTQATEISKFNPLRPNRHKNLTYSTTTGN